MRKNPVKLVFALYLAAIVAIIIVGSSCSDSQPAAPDAGYPSCRAPECTLVTCRSSCGPCRCELPDTTVTLCVPATCPEGNQP